MEHGGARFCKLSVVEPQHRQLLRSALEELQEMFFLTKAMGIWPKCADPCPNKGAETMI